MKLFWPRFTFRLIPRAVVVWAVVVWAVASGTLAAPETETDRLTLKDGTNLVGAVLDVSEQEIVFLGAEGKRFLARDTIHSIHRRVSGKFQRFFAARAEKSETIADWQKLAAFYARKEAHVEERKCLRKILRLDPENEDAHRRLGDVLFKGNWLDEKKRRKKSPRATPS